ncbi:unnamed protein product [Strongylus vulgaris]|uniref:Deacetylase sirtuin-type domain-containing protein n=1 Tax=Strongylus vulgaris TaxID=40348 RepID=A0A3P7JFT5_STRVU|nr:unnamed protein product [Strongylus vulgaris]
MKCESSYFRLQLEECTGILVLGSSLQVMSGYRYAWYAKLEGKPVYIVNIGPTRADNFADMRISAPVTEVVSMDIVDFQFRKIDKDRSIDMWRDHL